MIRLSAILGADPVVVPLDCRHQNIGTLPWFDRLQNSLLPGLDEGNDIGLIRVFVTGRAS